MLRLITHPAGGVRADASCGFHCAFRDDQCPAGLCRQGGARHRRDATGDRPLRGPARSRPTVHTCSTATGWAGRMRGDFGASFQNSVAIGPDLAEPNSRDAGTGGARVSSSPISSPFRSAPQRRSAPEAHRQTCDFSRHDPRRGAQLLAGDAARDALHAEAALAAARRVHAVLPGPGDEPEADDHAGARRSAWFPPRCSSASCARR